MANTISSQPLNTDGTPQVNQDGRPVLNSRTDAYGYDELSRLTSVDYGDSQTQAYSLTRWEIGFHCRTRFQELRITPIIMPI